MPLTSAQWVRQRIQDPPRYFDSAYYGDGVATRYMLPIANITSASAFVQPGGTAWSGTGATFNSTGYVDFATPISAQSAFRVAAVYTIFADDVIDERVSAEGLIGAALECAHDLMFDAAKRARWMDAQGNSWDDIGSITALRAVIHDLEKKQEQDAIFGGDFQSWSVNQQDY